MSAYGATSMLMRGCGDLGVKGSTGRLIAADWGVIGRPFVKDLGDVTLEIPSVVAVGGGDVLLMAAEISSSFGSNETPPVTGNHEQRSEHPET